MVINDGKESVCVRGQACVCVCVGVCVSVCVSSAAVFLPQTCWSHKCTSHFMPIRQTEIKIDTVGQPELQSVRVSRCEALPFGADLYGASARSKHAVLK